VSLVTTCPSCGTSFRVTPEQLAAHRGDVRCGNCQHIFSALKHLAEIAPSAATASQETPETATPEASSHEESTALQYEPAEHASLELSLHETTEIEQAETTEPAPLESLSTAELLVEVEAEEPLPEVKELHFDAETLDFEIESPEESPQEIVAESSQPVTEEIELTDHAVWAEDIPITEAVPAPPAEPSTASVQHSVAPSPEPEPLAATSVESKPKRRIPTWGLAVFSFLLILTGIIQTTYFLRNSIASHYPQAGPWLENLCRPVHCNIDLPRQADLLNIEDSDLKDDPEHDGVLILVSVLDNRAPFTQAAPLLELTLTDTFDHPLLRRTFKPQEYLPAGISPDRGIAAGAQVPIRLNLSMDGIKPAGYRLYVKY